MRARGHYMDINKFSPKFKVSSPNLINLSGLTTEDIFEYLYAAKALKTKYRAGENPALLKHKTIALLFGNVSTRTRISFEMGIRQLGGDFLFLPKGETQLSRGEEHPRYCRHVQALRLFRADPARVLHGRDRNVRKIQRSARHQRHQRKRSSVARSFPICSRSGNIKGNSKI